MPTTPFIIVAIDGGAASGKSSSSRTLSERFNLLHVDTGSYYRALTAEMLRRGVEATDPAGVQAALAAVKLGTRVEGRSAKMEIGGRVAGDEIRSREVNDHVSHFAAIPEMRTALLAYQRGQASVARERGFRGLVMEGRDIGSVIFPDATFRFFLHADPAERARRRANEGQQDSIVERDRLDSSRKTSPLSCPAGAVSIDTTHLTLAEVVEKMAAAIAGAPRGRMNRAFPQIEMEPVYGFFHYLSVAISEIAFRGRTIGAEHIPRHGGFLIAANHASHLDPFLIGARVSGQVTFFARKTLWRPGFVSWWLNKVGVIPVDRDGGSDVTAIKRVLHALKQGKTIIMFPEGTRSPNGALQSPKPGVGLFACRAQVPVIPARIFGSFEAFGKSGSVRLGTPVTVVFGRPLLPAAYDDPAAGKGRYLIASERIMTEIARLHPPEDRVI